MVQSLIEYTRNYYSKYHSDQGAHWDSITAQRKVYSLLLRHCGIIKPSKMKKKKKKQKKKKRFLPNNLFAEKTKVFRNFSCLKSYEWYNGIITCDFTEQRYPSFSCNSKLHDPKKVNWNLKINFIECSIIKHLILSPDSYWRFCPRPIFEELWKMSITLNPFGILW